MQYHSSSLAVSILDAKLFANYYNKREHLKLSLHELYTIVYISVRFIPVYFHFQPDSHLHQLVLSILLILNCGLNFEGEKKNFMFYILFRIEQLSVDDYLSHNALLLIQTYQILVIRRMQNLLCIVYSSSPKQPL